MRKLLALGAVLFETACFAPATTPYMRPAPAGSLGPAPADRARVVFIRPSGYVGSLWATIFDEQGTYLGDALPQACFYADVSPGSHTLVAWTRPLDTYHTALPAHLAPGKTYFVEVAIHAVAAFEMTSIVPEISSFANLDRWLRECRLDDVDRAAGQRALDAARKVEAKRFVTTFDDATVEPGRGIRLADGR